MTPEAFFHEESGAVRFWVRTVEGNWIGAMVRMEILHYRFRVPASGVDALKAYRDHQQEVDATALRRIAAGSIEPVMLREADFGMR